MTKYLLITLALSIATIAVFEASKPSPSNAAETTEEGSLDPNDCSRGIDEANIETCGGAS